LIVPSRPGACAIMSHRRSRLASRLPILALWLSCAALAYCIQLTDGSDGSGAPKTWGTAQRIHDEGTDPDVAAGPDGEAVAIWSQPDGVWSSRYTPTIGWGTAVLVREWPAEIGPATVVMDAGGHALAVWSMYFASSNIYASRSNARGQWGSFELIDDNSGDDALDPRLAASADGRAVAVWIQSDGTRDDIWSNRFTSADGWSFAQRIENNSSLEASGPQVAVNASGNAVAVWAHSDGVRSDIWSNRYTPSDGWGSAGRIETNNAGPASAPQVTLDAQGNAVAVWQQSNGTRFDIWSNRYTNDGWGAAERIETGNEDASVTPQVGSDAQGNAVAVWVHSAGTRQIWSNRYTRSGGWGTSERIDTNNTDAREPRVAVDPSGSAVAVWKQSGAGGDSIWSNRYAPSGGWAAAQRIDSETVGTRPDAQVAIDDDGNAIAIWSVGGSPSAGVWSNRME